MPAGSGYFTTKSLTAFKRPCGEGKLAAASFFSFFITN